MKLNAVKVDLSQEIICVSLKMYIISVGNYYSKDY